MAAPHRLPVEQAGLAVAEVDVAGMSVAVHDGVRFRVDEARHRAVVLGDEPSLADRYIGSVREPTQRSLQQRLRSAL